MSFDPTDPAINQAIIDQVSTMVASSAAQAVQVAEQQKNNYIQAQANQAFNAYTQQVPIVGQAQLNDLIAYQSILTNKQSTITGAISMLSDQLSNTSTTPFTELSTLLATPHVPTAIHRFFGHGIGPHNMRRNFPS